MSGDPLLAAVQRGDPRCPDGRALAALGRLARAEAPAPVDLVPRVLAALPADGADDGAAIDAWVAGAPCAPLDRLRQLRRELLAPAPADLAPRVRAALGPRRWRPDAAAAARWAARLRVALAVAAVHVLALLLVWTAPRAPEPEPSRAAAAAAPAWWAARAAFRGDGSALPELLAWLRATQRDDGTWPGPEATRTARQAFAVLALCGEGAAADAAARRAARALAALPLDEGPLLPALALARVEAALAVREPRLAAAADAALVRLAAALPARAAQGGLGGLAWLALEAGAAAGHAVPALSLAEARRRVVWTEPLDAEPVPWGLCALGRAWLGLAPPSGGDGVPLPAPDDEGRLDPLRWALAGPGIVLGPQGRAWLAALERALTPQLVADGAGRHLPAARARHAAGDAVLATAWAALALQAPRRYRPAAAAPAAAE